jgi:energy-coupling factor transport system permease protein
MFQQVTLGRFVARRSLVHALDPRSKLIGLLILMATVLLIESPPSAVGMVLLLLAAVILARLPWVTVFSNLRSFWWFFLLTFGLNFFMIPGQPILELYRLGLGGTHEGLIHGVVYSLRLIDLLTFAALLTLSTPPLTLTDGLERLLSPLQRIGVPVRDLGMMTAVAIRFVPTLAEESEALRRAQQARGAKFEGHLVQRIRALVPVLIPLFIRSFQRAEELAVAMEARCFVSGRVRGQLHPLKLTWRDPVAVGVLFVAGLFLVSFDRGWLAGVLG